MKCYLLNKCENKGIKKLSYTTTWRSDFGMTLLTLIGLVPSPGKPFMLLRQCFCSSSLPNRINPYPLLYPALSKTTVKNKAILNNKKKKKYINIFKLKSITFSCTYRLISTSKCFI